MIKRWVLVASVRERALRVVEALRVEVEVEALRVEVEVEALRVEAEVEALRVLLQQRNRESM